MKKKATLTLIGLLIINILSPFSCMADETRHAPAVAAVQPSTIFAFLSSFSAPIAFSVSTTRRENPLADAYRRKTAPKGHGGFPELYCFNLFNIRVDGVRTVQRYGSLPVSSLSEGTAPDTLLHDWGPPGGGGFLCLVLLLFLILLARSNLPDAAAVVVRRNR